MNHPKLISLLLHLNTDEVTSLKKYITSKTSHDSDSYLLFDYLCSKKVNLEEVYEMDEITKKLFPKSTVKAVNNYMSSLFLWSEEWVAIQQMKSEVYAKELLTLKWYNRKGSYYLADLTAKKIEKAVEEDELISTEKEEALFKMDQYQYISNNPIKNESEKDLLLNYSESYLKNVKVEILKNHIELINWGRIKNRTYTSIIDRLVNLEVLLPDSETSDILYMVLDLVKDYNVEALHKLKEMLEGNKIHKDGFLHALVYFYVKRFSVVLWSKGKLEDNKIIIEIIAYGLQTGFFDSYGHLSSLNFNNLLSTISLINDFEQVDKFINEWAHKIHTKNEAASTSLANGINCFYHERYDEAMSYCWRSDFTNFYEKKLSAVLHMLSSFALRHKDRETYTNSFLSYKSFLKRNRSKMSEAEYEKSLNLLDFIDKIDKNKFMSTTLNEYKIILYRTFCEKELIKYLQDKNKIATNKY